MTENPHPLDPATAEEYRAGREILTAAGLLTDPVRFAYYGLEEPPKDEVLSGGPTERRLRAFLLNQKSGESTDVVVSLTRGAVASARVIDTAAEGQVPIIDSEYHLVEEIMAADPDWQAALARRGLTDMSKIRIAPITAGAYRAPAEDDTRRIVRVLAFLMAGEHDLAWAHPVDGVTAHVDLIEKKVLRILDQFELPVPAESGDYDDPAVRGPERTTLKPIEITQPEGPSFTVEGSLLRWEGWSLRVGFDLREGLTLHQVSLHGRPVIYRASIPEMVVPYGNPEFRFWQAYFDTGEYLVGKWVNSLELGCDCLGEITYLDAVVTDEAGEPSVVRNAICIHEEDFGILWKHTDMFTGVAETRRQRRLVVSFFVTVGNYDYGFYWYFYLDGTIQLECKATGVVFTSSFPGKGYRWASEIAPGLGAPFHQHLFSARLDFALDGVRNAVDEVDAQPTSSGAENPWGNAIERKVTRLRRESDAARLADNRVARTWQIVNPSVRNRLGEPIGYALCPQGQPPLLAQPDSSIGRRATFASKHLWVTRYDSTERFPAGEFVNQHPGGAGLPTWTTQDRSVDDADIVVWHTFGLTHFPRPEDWPIMPVDYCGFTLKPVGFFDRNPSLDVAPSPANHCHHH